MSKNSHWLFIDYGAIECAKMATLPIPKTAQAMNPEVEVDDAQKEPERPIKRLGFTHRRLQEKLCESRMLEVLDRNLSSSMTLGSNQEHEDELVCVSTMVAVDDAHSDSTHDEFQKRVVRMALFDIEV